ncbi:hypothetical protein V6N13_003168 [Hibiscus sabdariffa]|uniref:Uncharacterized protein n=1 Tax=Hibiscus sabdariffa TaxID=183260 RepID=A0ABR2NDV7_9ROSI
MEIAALVTLTGSSRILLVPSFSGSRVCSPRPSYTLIMHLLGLVGKETDHSNELQKIPTIPMNSNRQISILESLSALIGNRNPERNPTIKSKHVDADAESQLFDELS